MSGPDAQRRFAHAGMACDVGQRLLSDTIGGGLGFRGEPPPFNAAMLEGHANAGLRRVVFDVPQQRRQ